MIVRCKARIIPPLTCFSFVVLVAVISPTRANEPVESELLLLADANDGQLDDFSLLEGALIASGVTDPGQIQSYVREFGGRVGEIVVASDRAPDAEQLYGFLHSEFLTGQYRSTCTEIDRALDAGDYNCVTATILYHCLCRIHGLSPLAVATSTHVRSRFEEPAEMDVETTCREWFDVVRRNPQAAIARTQSQVTRPLSDGQLLAKIYYNRGVSLLEIKDFEEAMALLQVSHALDPEDQPTRENLAAGMNNWALREADAGNFERAVKLVLDGWLQHPEFKAFAANDIHIHQRWAVALCDAGRFADALQTLHTAHQRRPDVELFDRGRLAVFGQWAVSLTESGEFAAAAELFAAAHAWCDNPAELSRYRAMAVQTVVDRLRHAGRDAEADRVERWHAELVPVDPRRPEFSHRLTTAAL